MSTSFNKRDARFSKFDDEHRIAYGWAIVSEEKGERYFDLQGDHIPMDSVITASIDFMKNSRVSDDMHTEVKTAEVVFCAPVMKGQLVDPDHPTRTGLWIGAQIHDDEVYEMTKAGKRTGFSIGGFLDEADYLGKNGELYSRATKGAKLRLVDRDFLAKREGTKKGAKPQRIFRSFRLSFISTVDLPAMEGALISVVKNANPESLIWLRKGVVLTSEEDGHQHVVDPTCFDEKGRGWTSSAQMSGKEYGYHSHDLVREDDGSITVAANAGHGHSVDAKAIEAPKQEASNPTETVTLRAPAASVQNAITHKGLVRGTNPALGCANKETKMATIEIEQSEHDRLIKSAKDSDIAIARAERAEKMAELTDAQKMYVGKLSGPGQSSFLAKSAVERETELKAQIEYTSPVTGDVYYKFDDARLVKNAKRADEAEKRSVEDTALAKRAIHKASAEKFLKAYPHDGDVHATMVEAIETIGDADVKKKAYEVLAAGQEALLSKTRTTGSRGPVATAAGEGNGAGGQANGTPVEKARGDLRAAVEVYQKANNIASYDVAFAESTGRDPTVRALYEQLAEMGN